MSRFHLGVVGLLGSVVLGGALAACSRGQISDASPIIWWDDMHAQGKYRAQSEFNRSSDEPTSADDQQKEGNLFADNRAMRPLVDGVVAQGFEKDDEGLWTGKVGEAFLAHSPIPVTDKLLSRGEERFHIYCTPCHDHAGSGNGLCTV